MLITLTDIELLTLFLELSVIQNVTIYHIPILTALCRAHILGFKFHQLVMYKDIQMLSPRSVTLNSCSGKPPCMLSQLLFNLWGNNLYKICLRTSYVKKKNFLHILSYYVKTQWQQIFQAGNVAAYFTCCQIQQFLQRMKFSIPRCRRC